MAGCGDEDFKNEARAPIREALTGVIQDDAVTVSPSKVGAGPVEITISNQTDAAHSITLEGDSVVEREGPVAPGDTATIQKTLEPGSYEVKAGSSKAVVKEIRPAVLRIGKERQNSNNDLLLLGGVQCDREWTNSQPVGAAAAAWCGGGCDGDAAEALAGALLDAAELLDVDVDELAGPGALVAAGGLERERGRACRTRGG